MGARQHLTSFVSGRVRIALLWCRKEEKRSFLADITLQLQDRVKPVEGRHAQGSEMNYLAVAISAIMAAPPPTAKASSRSTTAKSGISRLRLFRIWAPARAPAIAPSPPSSAPSASGRF